MDHPDLNRVRIELLLAQHRAALEQANALARLMAVLSLLGFLLLGGAAGLVLAQRAALAPALSWGTPLLFLVIFSAWSGLAAQQIGAAWKSKILAAQARRLAGENGPLEPQPDPLNTWRAAWKLRLLVAVPGLLFGGVYAAVLFLGGRSVYTANHLQGLGYAILFAGLSGLVAAALAGAIRDLPGYYSALYQAAGRGEGTPDTLEGLPELPRPSILEGLRPLGRWLVPLPAELAGWGWAYWAGFLTVPLVGMGLATSRLDLLNALFRNNLAWETADKLPAAALLGLGLVVFIFAELLLQQAAALWEAGRRGSQPLPYPRLQIGGRWLLAVLPAWWLGGAPLLALFLTYTAYEVLFMLLVAPRRQYQPALVLLVQAAGLPMRFLAGALVWGAAGWAMVVYQALAVVVYFVALTMLAVRWQSQALHQAAQGQLLARGETYFASRGGYWRHAGLVAALLGGGLLFLFQALAEQCLFAPGTALAELYASCSAGGQVVYAKIGLLNGLLLAFNLLIFLLLLGLLLAILLERLQLARQGRLLAALNKLRMVLVQFFFLLALAALIMSIREARAGWAMAGMLATILGMVFL